jgi:hypothetical protein
MSVVFDHGVEYKPSTAVSKGLSFEGFENRNHVGEGLSKPYISAVFSMIYFEEFIRFTWVDFSNTVRFRTLPVSYFKKLLASRRPGIGIAKACLGLNFITLADGFSPMGEYLYVPDLKSLRLCPYEPGQASVMGFFQEKTPWRTPEGTLSVETKACTRGALKRVVE